MFDQQTETDSITYELMCYTFEYMPGPGSIVALEQVAEDLDEKPEKILAVLDELRLDRLIDFTHDDGVIAITHRDEEFLKSHMAYNSIRY
jgi:hypothetical protein